MHRKAHAFTLIELLVVIGIIVLLVGLLLPVTLKAIGAGETTRMRADLVAIGAALDAYKQDYGRYPMVDEDGTGFAVLGQALIGAGPADVLTVTEDTALTDVTPGTVARDGTTTASVFVAVTDEANAGNFGNGTDWRPFGQFVDGIDGYGYVKGADSRLTQDPYLAGDTFNTNGSAILDLTGKPILYYPARAKRPNIHANLGYVSYDQSSLFDAGDNDGEPTVTDEGLLDLEDLSVLLGDFNRDRVIGAGEEVITQGNWVLMSPGSDQKFLDASNSDPDDNRVLLEESDDIVVGS